MEITCERDSDCLNDGTQYCLSSTCQKCLDCEELFNRLTPFVNGHKSCARTEKECGTCLPEYQSTNSESQQRTTECFPTVASKDGSPMIISLISLALIVIMISSIIGYIRCRRVAKKKNLNRGEEENQLGPLPKEFPKETRENWELFSTCVRKIVLAVVEQKYLNNAEPIDDFQRPKSPTYSNAETVSLESQHGDENRWTTIIPSLTETSFEENMQLESQPLIRSQSMEFPSLSIHPMSSLTNTTLPIGNRRRYSESYSYRYIRNSRRLANALVTVHAATTNDLANEPLLTRNVYGEPVTTFTPASAEAPENPNVSMSRLSTTPVISQEVLRPRVSFDFIPNVSNPSHASSLENQRALSLAPVNNLLNEGHQDTELSISRSPPTEEMKLVFLISKLDSIE